MTLKDNVQLVAKYRGRLEDADDGLSTAVDEALMNQTGLRMDDVTSVGERTYIVKIEPTEEGDKDTARCVGTSNTSIEDALQDATRSGTIAYDKGSVEMTEKRTVETPCFTVPVVARSINKDRLERHHDEAVDQLMSTYGSRLNPNPDSVLYRVTKSTKKYNDGSLPKGDFGCWLSRKLSIVKTGESPVSMDDALEGAKTRSKRVNSTVYEQISHMIVYGQPESSLEISPDGVAAPVVVTRSKELVPTTEVSSHQPRAGSGAVRSPPSLTSELAFM